MIHWYIIPGFCGNLWMEKCSIAAAETLPMFTHVRILFTAWKIHIKVFLNFVDEFHENFCSLKSFSTAVKSQSKQHGKIFSLKRSWSVRPDFYLRCWQKIKSNLLKLLTLRRNLLDWIGFDAGKEHIAPNLAASGIVGVDKGTQTPSSCSVSIGTRGR